jgi:hypothetical protein
MTYKSNFNGNEKHWLWLSSTLDGGMNFGFSQDGYFGFAEKGKEVTPTNGDSYNQFKFTIPQKTGEAVLSGEDGVNVAAAHAPQVEDTYGEWIAKECPNYKEGGTYTIIAGIIGNTAQENLPQWEGWHAAAFLLPTSRDRLKPSKCLNVATTNWYNNSPNDCPICDYELLLFFPSYFEYLDHDEPDDDSFHNELVKLYNNDGYTTEVEIYGEKYDVKDMAHPIDVAKSLTVSDQLDDSFDPYLFREKFYDRGKDRSADFWARFGEGGDQYRGPDGFNTSGKDLGNGVAVIPLKFDPDDPISLTSQSKFLIKGKGGDGADMWNPRRYLDDPECQRCDKKDEYLTTSDGHDYEGPGPDKTPWSRFKY